MESEKEMNKKRARDSTVIQGEKKRRNKGKRKLKEEEKETKITAINECGTGFVCV